MKRIVETAVLAVIASTFLGGCTSPGGTVPPSATSTPDAPSSPPSGQPSLSASSLLDALAPEGLTVEDRRCLESSGGTCIRELLAGETASDRSEVLRDLKAAAQAQGLAVEREDCKPAPGGCALVHVGEGDYPVASAVIGDSKKDASRTLVRVIVSTQPSRTEPATAPSLTS